MKIISVILVSLFCVITASTVANARSITTYSEIERIDRENVNHKTWDKGSFIVSKPDGSELSIELLRPKWWFKEHQIIVGKDIHLSLPEMGVDGLARVLSVNTIAQSFAEAPDGHEVVTGKFTHTNVEVIDLYFDNEKPLGVTVTHPFWSMDKSGWVDAGDLRVGENVKTIEGVAKLVKRVEREGLYTVYNLEVHRRHTFYVSDIGVLVHNTCFPDAKELAKRLGTSKNNYHKVIKPQMKKDFAQEMKKLGTTNPDFGVTKTGQVIVKNPKTGKIIITDVLLNAFRL